MAPMLQRTSRMAAHARTGPVEIPRGLKVWDLQAGHRRVRLTNLDKLFWPELGITKRDLLQYYADVSSVLVPHIRERAMVMKRYPDGAAGKFFFMKRTPEPHPDWIRTCPIVHASGNVVEFPVVDDLAGLLWIVNLGCIDLNQWYARCDDVDRPDYLHFDLDPTPGASWDQVIETALVVHAALDALEIPNYPKTTGSRGMHIYVPIVRGPVQKDVWKFAKAMAQTLAAREPDLITSEYRIARRPEKRVLVDYNQNAWGRTLASVYSVRPTARATVSAPLTWEEVRARPAVEDFRIDNMPERVKRLGDLFRPLVTRTGRFRLEKFL